MKFNVGFLLGIVALCSLGLGLGRLLWLNAIGPVIPYAKLEQLRSGMTPAQVEGILGKPSAASSSDTATYPTSETWYYERALNPGWVELGFDADMRLDWLNDESVHKRGRVELAPIPHVLTD